MKFSSILQRLRHAQHFQQARADLLINTLRSPGLLGKLLNFGLALAVATGRRTKKLMPVQPPSATSPSLETDIPPQSVEPQQITPSSMMPWATDAHTADYLRQPRVLIIAELSISQCRRYRVEQKSAALERLGVASQVVSWNDPLTCLNAMQISSMVIFYRTPATADVVHLHEEAKRLGLTTFFDIDDLVFDLEEYALNKNVQSLSKSERESLLAGGALYRDMLSLTDHAIASTKVIALYMQKYSKGQIFLVENALDTSMLILAQEPASRSAQNSDSIAIGYGSGTSTHDADFAVATPALLHILEYYPHVHLTIYGSLTLDARFERFNSRVLRVAFLNAEDYYRSLARLDINLAPLESSIFNDAKSNIKFIEASIFGIPSVCTPAAEFRSIIQHGHNGMLASHQEEWQTALSTLIDSPQLRQRIGEQARQTVLERYSPETLAHQQIQPLLTAGLPVAQTPKRRVLIVNLLFPPVSFGGATLVAQNLASGLHQTPDTECIVFTASLEGHLPPYTLRTYTWQGMPVVAIRLHLGGSPEHEFSHPAVNQAFHQLLQAYQPDIVHFHAIQGMGAAMAEVCTAQSIPYMLTLHDAWWLCERQFMVRSDDKYCNQQAVDPAVCASCTPDPAFTHRRYFYLRKIMLGASRIFVPSRFHQQLHIASGVPAERVYINKNGVTAPQRIRHPNKHRPLVFAYLGGSGTHKGYKWLRDIMLKISDDRYVLRLVDIERRMNAHAIHIADWPIQGQLEIVAPFSTSEIDDFYADIDVLLFPSQCKESFGLTVREALARHVWVISTDCGGPAEDVSPGVNGDLLAMDDALGFQKAIEQLIKKPGLLNNYRNPHAQHIHSYEDQVQDLASHIHDVLSSKKSITALQIPH
jgi:O-antigen biosynthesis protein